MLDGDGSVCRFGFSEDGEKFSFRSRFDAVSFFLNVFGVSFCRFSIIFLDSFTDTRPLSSRFLSRSILSFFSFLFLRDSELFAEEYADKILFRSTFGTSRAGGNPLANAFDFRLKNPANTHVVPWGGKLLALWEAGPPYELDPRSLETRPAPATLGGLVSPGAAPSTTGVSRALDERLGFGSALIAHPHVVPAPPGESDVWYGLREGVEEEEEEGGRKSGGGEAEEGKASASTAAASSEPALPLSPSSSSPSPSEPSSPPSSSPAWPAPTSRLATWAWQSQMTATGPNRSIEVAEFDAAWRRVARAKLVLPGAAFNPHDFGVSPHHYVFYQGHTTFKMLPYILGLKGPAQCVKIGSGKIVVHVAPRGQSHPQHSKPVSFEADEGGFLIHHAACFEDSQTGEIVVWSSGWAPRELERLAESAAGGGAAAAAGPPSSSTVTAAASTSSSFPSPPSFPSLFLSPSSSSSSSATDDSMLGSWKVVLAGDFDGIPQSSLQEHRIDLKEKRVTSRTLFDDQVRVFFIPFFYKRKKC